MLGKGPQSEIAQQASQGADHEQRDQMGVGRRFRGRPRVGISRGLCRGWRAWGRRPFGRWRPFQRRQLWWRWPLRWRRALRRQPLWRPLRPWLLWPWLLRGLLRRRLLLRAAALLGLVVGPVLLLRVLPVR